MIRNLRLLRRGFGSMDYIHTRFAKLSVRVIYAGEIRNYREYISTKSFRKAAYSQFILARHGHLSKGNGRVCPFLCGFTNKKTISLTYRCLHGLSRT